jgi:heme exporter protein A
VKRIVQLEAVRLRKDFNRRTIFKEVSFTLASRSTLLITGRNGSGKSTLVKILANVLTPTDGVVNILDGQSTLTEHRHELLGVVSPYLQLYDEFSAVENLQYALTIRGYRVDAARIDALLQKVDLYGRRRDVVRTYSSGMKQRLKYACALVHKPPILMLDEPMSNLDTQGFDIVRSVMNEQREAGILIVATNDLSDIEHYDVQVDLNAAI